MTSGSPTEPIPVLERIQEASFARASETTQRAFPAERRMRASALHEFLSSAGTGVLATVRPDGRPHAAPVGFALVGARVVIASREDAARVGNLRAEPHASLVVTREDPTGQAAVILEGTARLLPPLEAPLELRAPFRDPQGALPGWVDVLVVLAPERILSYAPPPARA